MRELAMSYFEDYFSAAGEKTLRAYHGPFDLRPYDRLGWTFEDAHIALISDRIDGRRHVPLLTAAMVRGLARVDPRSMEAGMLGTNPAGLYAGSTLGRRRGAAR
jgi:hypothetical protein